MKKRCHHSYASPRDIRQEVIRNTTDRLNLDTA